jgi:cellulose synthase operon protein C
MLSWVYSGLCAACLWGASEGDLPAGLVTAEEHLHRGRYAEAVEAYAGLSDLPADAQIRAVTGQMLALSTQGQRDAADSLLAGAIAQHPDNADLIAWKAQLLWERGEFSAAGEAAQSALQHNPDQARARLVQARVLEATGQLKAADDAYVWFVRYYKRAQPKDADTLLLVAEGSLQYARWHSVKQIFGFVLNTICVDALKDQPLCWEAHALAGQLLLEKYNRADGIPELERGLAINPQAVPILLTQVAAAYGEMQFDDAAKLVSRVLEINPQHPEALRWRALLAIQTGDPAAARADLTKSLDLRPHDQATQAALVFLDFQASTTTLEQWTQWLKGLKQPASIMGAEPIPTQLRALAKLNRAPGVFLQELGQLLDGQRRFPFAEVCYQQAIELMPQLAFPKTALGQLYLRTGRVKDARQLLDVAFKADPYHVRVSNLRKVLTVLESYRTVKTAHFELHIDAEQDALLAEYMSEYLEEVYAELTQKYGFEPRSTTRIEIYNKSQGLSGHEWFSARMVGLPWIQTIGASTGMLIAMTSPAATDTPFNWARVLRHELVHVLTLQQTDFNIPHWYTEALATREEGFPSPASWDELLAERVAEGNLRTLDTLHLGFQRADNREDWDFAYCQSVLYAEYFEQKFGKTALADLLKAYQHTRSNAEAMKHAFGMPIAAIEADYRSFLEERVLSLAAAQPPAASRADIVAAYEKQPDDPQAAGAFARSEYERGRFDEALVIAERVLASSPDQSDAVFVVAVSEVRSKNWDSAAVVLDRSFDATKPHAELWQLRAEVLAQLELWSESLEAYRLGREQFPRQPVWLQGIAETAERLDDIDTQRDALEQLCLLTADDLAPRKKLAQLALQDADYALAAKAARWALHVDVNDAEVHVLLAHAYRGLNQLPKALREYEVATRLSPDQAAWKLAWCETLVQAGQRDDAIGRLKQLVTSDPELIAAQDLLKQLSQEGAKPADKSR